MINLTFDIKNDFSKSNPVFTQISDAVSKHAGNDKKYKFIVRVSYNQGGEIEVMFALTLLIETTVTTFENISFDLRFGGFAISAAAFFFLYFTFFTLLPNVRVSSGSRLCVVYHKPRSIKRTGTKNLTIFANKTEDHKALNANELRDLLHFTSEFDRVINHFIATLKQQTGTAVDQHLIDSYNTNGDMAFTLSPKTFKTFK